MSRIWNQRGQDDDAESFIAESLAVLSTTFRAGLDAYDQEQYARAYHVLTGLSDDGDPYLAANASVFAIMDAVWPRMPTAAYQTQGAPSCTSRRTAWPCWRCPSG